MLWYVKFTWFTNLLAFLLGIFLYKRFPVEIKTVFYFVMFGILTEVYNKIHIHYIMKNSMPIGHFYFPIAIIIVGIFYIQILKDFIKPKWIIAIIISFVLYSIFNTVFIQGLFQYASVTASVGSLILFLFSVIYFIKVMIDAKIEQLSINPYIWINTGFLIYYTVGFFYHSLYNLRYKASIEVIQFAANIFSLLNLIFYLIISIGFILAVKYKHRLQN